MNSDSWVFFDEDEGSQGTDPASFAFPAPPRMDADVERSFSSSSSILNSLSPQERASLPVQLNKMQQQLLPYCLGSDESVVIGAPTGGGKTCLLDMAILRSLLVNDSSTQIYYIAPSKALCRLQALGFSHRFRNLNLSVEVVTGDEGELEEGEGATTSFSVRLTANRHQPSSHSLVVCTPEKLEAETRRCTDDKLAGSQAHRVLLLVDEVHHLGEAGRGAVLELVLTRFLWAFRKRRSCLRFVCVSATIPNIAQVAAWLNHAEYFEFTERPVPLTVRVLGYPKNESRSDYLFEQDLDRHVPEVLRQFGVGKPALVFVSSRKGAKDLAGKLRQAGLGHSAPTPGAVKTEDDALGEYLRWGIGFHSAGLSSQDRTVVENLFRAGKLLVVCCTSTLAVGVDLPANLCLIRSTRAYRGPLLGFQDLERATLIQMIGRAGRPGYDTEGTAVIMTSRGEEAKFADLSQGLLAVESQLVGNALLQGLNAELVRGRLTCKADCGAWWRMTFAGQSTAWRAEVLESLFALDCAREKPDLLGLESTGTGRVASTHHLRLETIARFALVCKPEGVDASAAAAEEKWDLQALAQSVCDGAEFAELLPRRDQKKFLNSVAWTLGRFKTAKSVRVNDGSDAAFQLLQAVMGGLSLPDQNLRQNANLVFERAPRLCRALLKMLVDVRSNKALVCSLFQKCLAQRCWEYDQVGQLTGVGVKTKEKLAGLGVQKLSEVALGKGGLPIKSVVHAKTLLAQKRLPQVAFVGNALVVSLSPLSSSTVGGGGRKKSSGWWLTCLGGPGNKLLCWSETVDRLVVPSQGLGRIMVFAIHQEFLGVDSRLVAQVDAESQHVQVVSLDSDFWEGFFLAEPKPTPVKKPRTKKDKPVSPEVESGFKDKIAPYIAAHGGGVVAAGKQPYYQGPLPLPPATLTPLTPPPPPPPPPPPTTSHHHYRLPSPYALAERQPAPLSSYNSEPAARQQVLASRPPPKLPTTNTTSTFEDIFFL